MREKVLGIVGGMGPEATVDFMQRIISLTPANDDQQHIRMIVDNNPKIPSRIKALIEGTGEDPTPELIQIGKNLQSWGADLIAIPCNTAHYYYHKIQDHLDIPVLNMIDIVLNHISETLPTVSKIGFLGSTAVIITQLYEKSAAQLGLKMIYPDSNEQNLVMKVIRKIKTSRYTDHDLIPAVEAAQALQGKGADVLIIGCTELSATAHVLPESGIVLDASQVLAEAVVQLIKHGK